MEDYGKFKMCGKHDEGTISQMWRCLADDRAAAGVLCADGHLGYAQPVGGVVAYEDHVSISGVGYDIGCGNMAAKLDLKIQDLEPRLEIVSNAIAKDLRFGLGVGNDRDAGDHRIFDDSDPWMAGDVGDLMEMARCQLGSIGSGNHYVDIFRDEDDYVWVGVHFGSRGLGHKIASRYLKLAGGRDGMHVSPTLVDPKTELGARYVAAMQLAGDYAYAGREWVVNRVRKMIGAKVLDSVHNHHNYAWRETHDGRDYWVVRKGATPAFPGQRGFVGGSMGDDAVIISGVESDQSASMLYSTIHGAGRLYGRAAAKRSFTKKEMDEWLDLKGVKRYGGDVDESPMAYRRLTDVLAEHDSTINVEHVLRPVVVFMAGRHDHDPYKD